MEFDFNFNFPSRKSTSSNNNMQDFMDKVVDDNNSFNWQNFNTIPQNRKSINNSSQVNSKKSQNVSDIFDQKKSHSNSQSNNSQNNEDQHQRSRDLNQISYYKNNYNDNEREVNFFTSNRYNSNNLNNNPNNSFQFEKSSYSIQSSQQQKSNKVLQEQQKNNNRYERIQKLLNKAKTNNLAAFYNNLDNMNKQKHVQIMFQNKGDFKKYVKDLKNGKRQYQEKFFVQKQKEKENQRKDKDRESDFDFSKKPTQKAQQVTPSLGKGGYQQQKVSNSNNNFLPQQYNDYNQNEKYADHPHGHQNYQYQLANNFDTQKQAKMFMSQSNPLKKKKSKTSTKANNDKNPDKNLAPIRQQKATLFEKTFEQQKLNILLNNYHDMKGNFQQLMHQLKDTSEGQNKIYQQLKKIKQEQKGLDKRQYYQQKKLQKQRNLAAKKQQFDQLKQQINKIKENNKQILFLKINQKIQTLEEAVKSALSEIAQEKEQSFTPKIINYFCEGQNQKQGQNDQYYQNNSNAAFSQQAEYDQYNKRPINQNYIPNAQNVQYSKASRYTNQQSNNNPHNRRVNTDKSNASNQNIIMMMNKEDFISPFDLAMQDERAKAAMMMKRSNARSHHTHGNHYPHNTSYYQNQDFQEQSRYQDYLSVPDFAKQYFPKNIDPSNNKNLRKSLTQKSSLVFQSFEFHVSAKYIITQDQVNPLIAQIRIGNKCMVNLSDVFVIIYGNKGADIQTKPTKIYQNILKNDTSFSFEVYLNKQCLQDNGFFIQISYKTDIISKKKVNFKVPLPIIQLIKPQFIYQQQFVQAWRIMKNQLYIRPKTLDFMHIRSHQDLKLILPFTHISQDDNPNIFSYGIMFRYPKSQVLFLLKLQCSINGKASVHLRSDRNVDNKIKQQILDVINFLIFVQ